MAILLPELCTIARPEQYKVHLACWNQKEHPLDVYVRDRGQWDGWNSWRSTRDDFTRDYIFSLIEFYPQKDRWLFGGIYKVISRKPIDNSHSYQVERANECEGFVGRLKLELKRPGRGRAFNFERHYQTLVVSEILPKPYSGESFPGYEQIDIGFFVLEDIIKRQRADWKAALINVKGVYLITDTSNGKRYVGSAYGDFGIWSRWECYITTGHGNNQGLIDLIEAQQFEHARTYFRFALLDLCSMKTDDHVVRDRETYWKKVLLTRGDHGYNEN